MFSVLKMAILTKTQSTTCATVSPATSFGVTRRITREESHPGTTPCPLGGAALPLGKRTTSQAEFWKIIWSVTQKQRYDPNREFCDVTSLISAYFLFVQDQAPLWGF